VPLFLPAAILAGIAEKAAMRFAIVVCAPLNVDIANPEGGCRMRLVAGLPSILGDSKVRKNAELKSFVCCKIVRRVPAGSNEDSEIACAEKLRGRFDCLRIKLGLEFESHGGGKGLRGKRQYCRAASIFNE
jgi:hypothetical protein